MLSINRSLVFLLGIFGFGSFDLELYQLEDFSSENTEVSITKVLFCSSIFLFFDLDFDFERFGIFLTTQAEDSVMKFPLSCFENGFEDLDNT